MEVDSRGQQDQPTQPLPVTPQSSDVAIVTPPSSPPINITLLSSDSDRPVSQHQNGTLLTTAPNAISEVLLLSEKASPAETTPTLKDCAANLPPTSEIGQGHEDTVTSDPSPTRRHQASAMKQGLTQQAPSGNPTARHQPLDYRRSRPSQLARTKSSKTLLRCYQP